MATEEAVKATAGFARARAPSQIWLCPCCRLGFQPGEREEDHDETWEEYGVLFHKPCRVALVLYDRA